MANTAVQTLSPRFRLLATIFAGILICRLGVKLWHNHLNTRLMAAVRAQNVGRIADALRAGADVFATDVTGVSTLDVAGANVADDLPTHNAVLGMLLDHIAVERTTPTQQIVALRYAARCGRTDIVQRLLARGADVNGGFPFTPLVYAVVGQHLETARVLISHHADIRAIQVETIAPALLDGNTALINLMISRGMDVNARQEAPDQAEEREHIAETVLDAMPFAKRERQLRAEQVRTELGRIISQKIDQSRNFAAMQASRHGMTPLMWAVINTHTGSMSSHIATVDCLLAHGANVNARDHEGRTALHYALSGDPDEDKPGLNTLIGRLIAHGADVVTPNTNGVTSAMYAARAGHLKALRLMLDRGVDINARDRAGLTVLARTIINHNRKIDDYEIDLNSTLQLLLARGADVQILPRIIAFCSETDVAMLLKHGASVNARDKDGNTVLHNAVQSSRSDNVRLLLEHGANPNAVDRQGVPVLLRAAGSHFVTSDIVPLLLAHGATPTATDKENKTALHYAAASGQIDTVRRLLELGLPPNCRDSKGETPLIVMLKGFHPSLGLLQLLLDHHADVNVSDTTGVTALQAAIARGHLKIAARLKEAGAR